MNLFLFKHLEEVKESNQHAIHRKGSGKSTGKSRHQKFTIPQHNTKPMGSVKIQSSGPSATSEGDGEDVTSNDTIPVSNETEAELSVNETGPGYFDLKDAFSVSTTQELKEIPRVMKDSRSLNTTNKDTFLGKDYSSLIKQPRKPTSVGKAYSNEMEEKELPEVIHFENKTLKNHNNSGKTGQEQKSREINTSLMKRLCPFDRKTEFDPSSRIETAHHNSSTSMQVESKSRSTTVSDPSSKKTTIVNEKLKSEESLNFAKILKRVEKMLRKSRISSHNDLRRMRKVVHDLGHLARAQTIPKRDDSEALALNATEGMNSRLKGIEKRMYVADGNEVLNNITTVLVQLFEKIQNFDGHTTAKPGESVIKDPKESYVRNGHHLKMADMVGRMKHLEKVFQKHLVKEKLTKCKVASSILDQMTLAESLDNLRRISHGVVKDMDQCVQNCCGNKLCDLAFLENSVCYGIDCKHQKCLLNPVGKHSVESSVALLTKRMSANIGFTGSPIGHSPTDKCEVQPHIITDSVLGEGGLKGNATVLEHVTDTWSCGMECCKMSTCNVAMIQDDVCYIISCLSDGPCFEFDHAAGKKTSLAFVRRSQSKVPILQPSSHLPTLKIKGTPAATTAHVSMHTHQPVLSSIPQMPSPTRNHPYSSPTLNNRQHSSHYSKPTYESTQTLSKPKDKNFSSIETSSLTNVVNSPDTCVQTFPVSNVTLRAGFSAGNFKFLGKSPNTSICVDHCCRTNDCDVAFVLQNMCFLVTCSSNKLCQNEPLLSSEFKSSLVYIARSPLEADMVKEELVPTMKRNTSKKSKIDLKSQLKTNSRHSNVATTQSGCSIGFIASNAKFLHGFESGEVISMGKLKGGVNECISKCCEHNGCNASLAISEQCFLVKCYTQESCQIVESDSSVETSVAIVTRRIDDNSLSFLLPQPAVKEASSLIRSGHVKQEISSDKTYTQDSMKSHNSLSNGQQALGYHSLEAKISPSLVYSHEATSSTTIPTHPIKTKNTPDTGNDNHVENLRQGISAPVSVTEPPTVNEITNLSDGQRNLEHISSNLHTSKTVQNSQDTKSLVINSKTSGKNVEKESIPETDKNLANSEILRKIQEGLENLVQANKKSKSPHSSKSEFGTHGIDDHHIKNLPKIIAHSKDLVANLDISTNDARSKFSRISELPNSKSRKGGMENKNSQNSETTQKQHLASPKLDELVSKITNLSLQQKQLKKKIPAFDDIIGKIQQHLDNRPRLTDGATNKGERKDSIIENNNINNSSILGLPKASIEPPKVQKNPLSSQKTTIIPTPKLVQSPTALVTSPSLTGLQKIRSTNHRAPTTSVKFFVSVDGISNEKRDIDKEVVMALKSAGVIPINPEQSHSRAKVLNTEARLLQNAKYTNPTTKSHEKSSIVPAAQRLLNFLKEQIRLKTKDSEPLKDITKSTEQSKYSKRINGLMDEQHILNEHIKNLESEIHQLKSPNNLHPSKSESPVKMSNTGLGAAPVKSTRKGKQSEEHGLLSAGESDKELTTQGDKTYLTEQLRSIVRSELMHKNQILPTPSMKLHSSSIKELKDRSNTKMREVILEHNLNRLYNHAAAEMEKALESSGKRENEGKWSSSNDLVQDNVKKNHIVSKKVNLLPNTRERNK